MWVFISSIRRHYGFMQITQSTTCYHNNVCKAKLLPSAFSSCCQVFLRNFSRLQILRRFKLKTWNVPILRLLPWQASMTFWPQLVAATYTMDALNDYKLIKIKECGPRPTREITFVCSWHYTNQDLHMTSLKHDWTLCHQNCPRMNKKLF